MPDVLAVFIIGFSFLVASNPLVLSRIFGDGRQRHGRASGVGWVNLPVLTQISSKNCCLFATIMMTPPDRLLKLPSSSSSSSFRPPGELLPSELDEEGREVHWGVVALQEEVSVDGGRGYLHYYCSSTVEG